MVSRGSEVTSVAGMSWGSVVILVALIDLFVTAKVVSVTVAVVGLVAVGEAVAF